MADLIAFGLAYVAYLLLGTAVVLRAWGRPLRAVSVAAAVVAVVHVGLVWGLRFGWSLSYALEKSLPGFVIFHTALAILVTAALVREPWAGRFTYLAFPVVTSGAVGAAFRYDDVAGYRLPLLAAFGLVVALAGLGIVRGLSGDSAPRSG